MAFEVHSDTALHPAVQQAGLAGWGVFVLCGTWTSANGETGVVPDSVVEKTAGRDAAQVADALVSAGLWTRVDGGYQMEYGPGDQLPLPLWRYGDTPSDGRLFTIVPDPEG